MSVFKRIIAVFMAFSIIISMVTVVSAAESNLADTASVSSWNSYISSVGDDSTVFWNMMNSVCADARVGDLGSLEKLQNAAYIWEKRATILYNQLALKTDVPDPVVAFDASYGVYRLQDRLSGNYIVNASGRFAYYCDSQTAVPDDYKGQIMESTRKDQWLPFTTANSKKQVSVLTKDSLSDLCLTLNQTDRTCSVRDTIINEKSFYVIIDTRNNIYANADGVPYVAHYEATVTDQGRDYIINEGDTLNEGDTIYNDNSTIIEGSTTNYEIVDNSKVIDLTNGTLNYIGEQNLDQFYIDELLYDFSSQSYSADTYNVTYDNDTYNTWNYTWNITYNITNTYVTNIGQTELYKPLELYYALPDGRSSADLTAEEIAGMSFEFADCVNYAKSATDTYLRALYHFDGNTDDSSYFSTQGKFEWVEGASITYMDVGTFDGALYLGPEKHQLKITLPSNIGSGDFSLQFRYYQEGAADTQTNIENSLSIGGTTVLQWDEGSLYSKTSTTACASLGVGAWSEIAVVRHSGTTYLYYNGLKISSFADTAAYSGDIVLTLGDTTRASSMLDELRVVNFAVAESGASYTCTAVPYDTNSVLVLPDSAFPIADEYWDIKSSSTNMLTKYGSDIWLDGSALNSTYVKDYMDFSNNPSLWYNYPYLLYSTGMGTVIISYPSGVSITSAPSTYKTMSGYSILSPYNANFYGVPDGLYSIIYRLGYDTNAYEEYTESLLTLGNTYTFSMVSSNGEIGSLTFTMDSATLYSACLTSNGHGSFLSGNYIDFNGYRIGLIRCMAKSGERPYVYREADVALAIIPWNEDGSTPAVSDRVSGGEFVYLELVEGSSTDLTAEWVTCMYSSEEVKPNTAAIQTDIPINGYTVGGVRPTFPSRGDVWMPVSNNRISGVYIYNGSAWEEANARWYTGTRWIPIYGFDITTLEDCWDIADIDTTIVMIGSESQFWSWLQGAWQKMLDKLDAIIIALGGDPNYSPDSSGGGGTGLWDRIKTAFSDALASIIESLMSFITDVLQLVLDLVYDLLAFFFDFLSTEVVTGIANLFSAFTDGSLLVFFQQEVTTTDEDGNEVTTTVIGLPDGITTAFAFFAGVIMILPEELRNLLIFGVGALILIGILKLAKS